MLVTEHVGLPFIVLTLLAFLFSSSSFRVAPRHAVTRAFFSVCRFLVFPICWFHVDPYLQLLQFLRVVARIPLHLPLPARVCSVSAAAAVFFVL